MRAETDLDTLLRNLQPELRADTFVFCSLPNEHYGALTRARPIACMAEDEGLSLVLAKATADEEGLTYEGTFRCISLRVHSSLVAVGLTAAVSQVLAEHGISANVIAGAYHDHLFVPCDHSQEALRLLNNIGAQA
ncbi:MAG: hypothetical protein CMH55_08810 [Myxococcales bacterium]|nr:hypothetical protein [Myxococcales bacterium]|tara:strand:- start:452 stop:856 length:405 start_codon:yes stop_codon:yes gene_type:complete